MVHVDFGINVGEQPALVCLDRVITILLDDLGLSSLSSCRVSSEVALSSVNGFLLRPHLQS